MAYDIHDWVNVSDDWISAIEANGYDIPPEIRVQVVGNPGVSEYHETLTDSVNLVSSDSITYAIDWFKWGGFGKPKDQDFTFTNDDSWFDSVSGVSRENIGDFIVVEFCFSNTEWKPLYIGRIQGVKRNIDMSRTITAYMHYETWLKRNRPRKHFAMMPTQYISKKPIMNGEYRELSTGAFYLYKNTTHDTSDYPGTGSIDTYDWPKTFSFWAERGLQSWVGEEKIAVKTWYGPECWTALCYSSDEILGCGASGDLLYDNPIEYNARYFWLCQNFVDNNPWQMGHKAITVFSRGESLAGHWNECVASGVNWVGRARARGPDSYIKGEAYSIHPPHIRYSDVVDIVDEWVDGARYPFALIDGDAVVVGGVVGHAGPDPDHWRGMIDDGYSAANAWDPDNERTLWPYWGIRLKGVISQTNRWPYPGYVNQRPDAPLSYTEVNQTLFPDIREQGKTPEIPESNSHTMPWFFVCYSPSMCEVSGLTDFPMAAASNDECRRSNPVQVGIALTHYLASGTRLDYGTLDSTPAMASFWDSVSTTDVQSNPTEHRFLGFDYHVKQSRAPGLQWRYEGEGSGGFLWQVGLDEDIIKPSKNWETVLKNLCLGVGMYMYQSPWGTVDLVMNPGSLSSEQPTEDCQAYSPRFVATLAGPHPQFHHTYTTTDAQASGFDEERDAWDLSIEEMDATAAVDYKFRILDPDQSFGITKTVEVRREYPVGTHDESSVMGSDLVFRSTAQGASAARDALECYGQVWSVVKFKTPMARLVCNPIDSKYLFRPGAKIHVTDNTQSWAAWCDVVGLDFDIIEGVMQVTAVTCSTTSGTDGCVVVPPVMDFGAVDEYGYETMSMRMFNPGATQLTGTFTITGAHSNLFVALNNTYDIAPGDNHYYELTFNPNGAKGVYGATVSFTEGLCYTVELVGLSSELSKGAIAPSGSPQSSMVQIPPESVYSIGIQDGPGNIRQDFFMQNIGEGNMQGEFRIRQGRTYGSGGEWAFDLEDAAFDLDAGGPGAYFYTRFRPWGPGTYWATLEGDSPMYNIYLRAEAIGWFGPFGILPSGDIGFGATMAYFETGTREVQVRNFLDQTLVIDIEVSELDENDNYSCSHDTVTLSDETATTTEFYYAPSAAGGSFAAVTFSTTYSNVETTEMTPFVLSATLFGGSYLSGTEVPIISVFPQHLTFNDTWVVGGPTFRDFQILNLAAVTHTLNWNPNGVNEYFYLDTQTAPESYMDETEELLYPGMTISGRVGFDPGMSGMYDYKFLLFTGTDDPAGVYISCTGRGISQDMKCKINPPTLLFNDVPVGTSESQVITVSNTLPYDLLVATSFTDAWATGTDVDDWAFEFVDEVISGGFDTTCTVTFSPSRRGTSNYHIYPGDSCIGVACMGAGSAYFKVEPRTIDFGQQIFHTEKTLDYVVSNTHTTTITVSRALTGDGEFNGAETDMVLSAESEATGTVTYLPTGEGEHTGLITFDWSGAQPFEVVVTGTSIAPIKPVYPANFVANFGRVAVGASAATVVVFQNRTNSLIILEMYTSGVDASSYSWVSLMGGTNPYCYVLPTSTAGIGMANVTFAPLISGTKSTALYDVTGQLEGNVTLLGEAVSYPYTLTPTELTFGAMQVGESAEASYKISNMLGKSLSGITRTLSGDTGHFTTSSTSIILAPDGQETHCVTYQPTGEGPHELFISFSTSDSDAGDNNTATLRVVGACVASGVSVPELIVTPNQIDFGTVYLNNDSYREFQVLNLTTITQTLIIADTSGDGFSFVEVAGATTISNSGGTPITPGQTLTGKWVFSPNGDNSAAGHTTSICDTCGDTHSILVTGFDAAHDFGTCHSVPEAVGFGVIECSDTLTLPLTVYNNNDYSLVNCDFTVTGQDQDYFTISTNTDGPFAKTMTKTIGDFGSINLWAKFNPGRTSPAVAGIVSDGLCNNITLHGSARNEVVVETEAISFGTIATGTTVTGTFTINNYGDTGKAVIFPTPEGFTTNPTPGVTVGAGSGEDVDVIFSPVSVTSYGGTIPIRDYDDGNSDGQLLDIISVAGQGIDNTHAILISPNQYDWGNVLVSHTTYAMNIVLKNVGTNEFDYDTALNWDAAGNFDLITAVTGTLLPGEEAVAVVECTPQGTGTKWCHLDWNITEVEPEYVVLQCAGVYSHETWYQLVPVGVGTLEEIWVGGPTGNAAYGYIRNVGGFPISGTAEFVGAESSTDGQTWHSASDGDALNPPFAEGVDFDLDPKEEASVSVWANNGATSGRYYRAYFAVTATGTGGPVQVYTDLVSKLDGWGEIDYHMCINIHTWGGGGL